MAQENMISAEITAPTLTTVKTKTEEIRTLLANVLTTNLTAEERQNRLKMGEKTVAFVAKALEFATNNPTLVPSYLNLAEAKKDYALVTATMSVLQGLTTLQRGLEDTQMVAGSEAYDAALIFYSSIKNACHSNVPGAQAIYDELKKQFPRPTKQELTATK
ncbi:hypothetical protein [Paludibacter jiangxiensis]|uniref:Uncharacterized protein n=1 Tax=Paludibacter jiangxiensis TaxID=681398 RepID=A0A170ZSG9_9BACT|nr:hypothetical protein [Paludibacter jiangxiensis]GAT62971.1 hypothetical protein PJIAN_3283 [Paludibacter jiangxiensis]